MLIGDAEQTRIRHSYALEVSVFPYLLLVDARGWQMRAQFTEYQHYFL